MKRTPADRRRPLSYLLAIHEDLPSEFFELLEEHAELLHEETELPQGQVDLPFTPETQQAAGCVWSYRFEADSHLVEVWFSHDVFCFLPVDSRQPRAPTEGGGPVKRFLTTGQKCLFSTAWMKRY